MDPTYVGLCSFSFCNSIRHVCRFEAAKIINIVHEGNEESRSLSPKAVTNLDTIGFESIENYTH